MQAAAYFVSCIISNAYTRKQTSRSRAEGVCCTSKSQIESWQSTTPSLTLVQQSLNCCVECKQSLADHLIASNVSYDKI